MTRSALITMLSAVLMAAGCSPASTAGQSAPSANEGAGTTGSNKPTSAESPSADNPRDLLDTQLNDADARFLYLAEGQLVGDCMREAGFEYSVVPPGDDTRDANPAARRHWGEYAFDDVEAAHSTGYGISLDDNVNEDQAGKVPDDPNAIYLRSLSEQQRTAWQYALGGNEDDTVVVSVPGGGEIAANRSGCIAKARRELYGSVEKHLEAASLQGSLLGLLNLRIEGDPRIDEALAEWRGCMIDRGYSFDSPMDAYNQVAIPIIEGRASQQSEIDVATVDTECNRQTGLAATAHAVETERVASLLDDYQSQIVEIRLMRQRAVERAQELTSVGEG